VSEQLVARSVDGTPIAVHRFQPPQDHSAVAAATAPPVLLIHGTASDHTTFRHVGPLLATSRDVFAMDRRGRGASGDTPPYAIDREYEDAAAVAELLADQHAGGPVDLIGHSFGGRVSLGAGLVAPGAIRRIVAYEGAPVHVRRRRVRGSTLEAILDRPAAAELATRADLVQEPQRVAGRRALENAVREALDRRTPPDVLLERFLALIVGMSPDDLAAYRAHPVWPDRVAAAGRTLLRELDGASGPASGLERLGRVGQPVLLVLGGASNEFFRIGTERLAARLRDVRVARIEGARHAAHHTHPAEFVRIAAGYLDEPARA
jgi:pimeloyl-ACP methyl ester carboxylesterase